MNQKIFSRTALSFSIFTKRHTQAVERMHADCSSASDQSWIRKNNRDGQSATI